jgi:hypothetical protein
MLPVLFCGQASDHAILVDQILLGSLHEPLAIVAAAVANRFLLPVGV